MIRVFECDDCHGLGEVRLFAGNIDGGKPAQDITIPCPECKGKGTISIQEREFLPSEY